MREDCRHFESRTYKSGEIARYCTLDLAPEAPWRCPEDCPSYQPSIMRRTFQPGSLQRPDSVPPPEGEGIGELLDAAEDIVNSVHAEVVAQVDVERHKRRWWQRFRKRGRGDGPFRLSQR